ncbi:hypothetical protein IJ118_02975 [Candidatus Saccharibacteria bacterium]|nr:hypothetical protein [Candidatus Saccharibacteria bacterium]
MNKDVIYIEPEDDITDIITKIENSKEKIIALVPPKKAGVFRSIVNIKLMAKAAASANKTVVLVTVDPSIIKLAAATRLPVTKNLQSAPSIPKQEDSEPAEVVSHEEVIEEAPENTDESGTMSESSTDEKYESAMAAAGSLEGKSGFLDDDSDKDADAAKAEVEPAKSDKNANSNGDEKKPDEKSAKKEKKPGLKSSNPVVRWVQEHKKLTIFGGIAAVVLVAVIVWATVIAPAATITVGIRTTSANFSENVTFTDKLAEENTSEGKFYLEEKKIEEKSEVTFEATGKKNVGEKASGDVVVYAYFQDAGQIAVNAGTIFTYDGKSYISQAETTLSWNGKSWDDCDNKDASASEQRRSGCQMSARVAVVAEGSGTSYNVSASTTGWTTVANVAGVYSDKAMAGGTDKTITVVQQSDIDKAKEKLTTANESANKQKLLATIADDAFIIESSFKQTVGEATSTPALGEEVKEGEQAKLSVVTTDTIDVIDSTKVEEFIREKAKLADNFKIYEMNDPFIENFTKTDDGYVAKIKTSYVSGPKITESDVVEIVKGKGVGTARQDLEKAYDGISRINIQTNYPWVSSVPNDNNKITVDIEVDSK